MRDMDRFIVEARLVCPEELQIKESELRKLFADSKCDPFELAVSAFYFGFAVGARQSKA